VKVTKDDLIAAAIARLEAARKVVQTRRALETAVGNMKTARDLHATAMQDSERALIAYEQTEARILVQEMGTAPNRLRAAS
jgi:uncharacterized protein